MSETTAPNEELIAGFVEEATDLLQELPQRVEEYQRDPTNSEAINVVFRSVHTVKGNAGFFGLIALKQFAHKLEDVFDEIRQGRLSMFDDLYRCLVECLDMLEGMIGQVADGHIHTALTDEQAELLIRLEQLAANSATDSPEAKILAEIRKLAEEAAAAGVPQSDGWAHRLEAVAELISNKNAPENVEAADDDEDVPPSSLTDCTFKCAGEDVTERVRSLMKMFNALDAGTYQNEDGQAFLDAANDFAEWATQHKQDELATVVAAARADFHTVFESPIEVDAFLVSVIWDQLRPAICAMRPPTTEQEEPKQEDAKQESQSADSAKKPADAASKSRILRIKEERVDQFLDDVSSLFITCERLKDLQTRMASQWQANELIEELRQINTALAEQSTDLQRSVVEIRKVSVMGLFSKFPRVARSLATNLGKKLNIHMEGEQTEIDKSLVEDLDGPLMHMIRNVCDHGIETPDEREAKGAPPDGNLWLKCELTKTHVVIIVRDDGRGIDAARLRNKVVEKKIMREEQATALSEQEAVELIFHPGFSTADQITEVSGRGVGLDVVRTRLREYKGDVHVRSQLGVGTTFSLEIPVRKAVVVVDGLLIRQNGSTFVLAFEHIREIVNLSREEISTVRTKPVVTIRGEPYAAVHLAELLGFEGNADAKARAQTGVLVRTNKGTICLLVETVVGQRKVVINSLSELLECSDRLHGVAQLGGGQLALVLNGPDLVAAGSAMPVGV